MELLHPLFLELSSKWVVFVDAMLSLVRRGQAKAVQFLPRSVCSVMELTLV